MKALDKKYGIDSKDKRVKEFHLQRQMFVIIDNIIYTSPKNVIWTHLDWFKSLGFNSLHKIMTKNPRGYYDNTGLYFYKDYDFSIDENSEKVVLDNLENLANKLEIPLETHLFGGIIRKEESGKWPPKKDYGIIKNLI